jgi:hypothetical protein
MKRIIRILALTATCLFVCGLTLGCNTYERDTFNTLSVSKSVLDTAQSDYETGTLPHTACVYALINDGKALQTAAVASLLDYDRINAAKGDTTAEVAAINTDLASIASDVAKVKALYTTPNCGA